MFAYPTCLNAPRRLDRQTVVGKGACVEGA